MGTSAPQACWTIVGIGIRLAQDVGAHRRKAYSHKPTVDEELWKRAFWYGSNISSSYIISQYFFSGSSLA
jgi:hypothetical protein